MDFVVEKMSGFKVIGYEYIVSSETYYTDIPKVWDKFASTFGRVMNGKAPENAEEKTVAENCIGEFGICIDDAGKNKFRYLIAGAYKGGDVPNGMTVFELPDANWAKFKCVGPLPGALQSVNTRIFREWLPRNPDYEIAFGTNIEWYSKGDSIKADYESEIWIPLKHK